MSSSSANPASGGDEAARHDGLFVYGAAAADGDGAASAGNGTPNACGTLGRGSGSRKRKAAVICTDFEGLMGDEDHDVLSEGEDSSRISKEIENLRSQLAMKNKQLRYARENEKLKAQLSLKAKVMEQLIKQTEELKAQNEGIQNNLKAELALKQKVMEQLIKQNEELKAQNEGLQNNILEALDSQIEAKKQHLLQLERCKKALELSNAQLEEKDNRNRYESNNEGSVELAGDSENIHAYDRRVTEDNEGYTSSGRVRKAVAKRRASEGSLRIIEAPQSAQTTNVASVGTLPLRRGTDKHMVVASSSRIEDYVDDEEEELTSGLGGQRVYCSIDEHAAIGGGGSCGDQDTDMPQEMLEDGSSFSPDLALLAYSETNKELQDARKELIQVFEDMASEHTAIGIKRMGELPEQPFKDACRRKYVSDDPDDDNAKAEMLICSWKEQLKDPSWHPFKIVEVNGQLKQVVDEEDVKLRDLRAEYGDDVCEAVKTAVVEMNEHNPNGGYVVRELWNYSEGQKATTREALRQLVGQLNC